MVEGLRYSERRVARNHKDAEFEVVYCSRARLVDDRTQSFSFASFYSA